MRKKTMKVAALLACAGTVFQFGGCLGNILPSALTYGVLEFALDNDGIFDLFEDGNVAAAE